MQWLVFASIYHPKNKFKFIQSPTPATRWVKAGDGQAMLRIKRNDGWKQLDPSSGVETADIIENALVTQLSTLEGFDEKQAKSVAQSLIADSKRSLESSLARIEDSIAIVGTNETCRWITRAAKAW